MNEWKNCRIWGQTASKIRLIGHLTERPQVQVIDEMANRILEELKVKHPEYAERINKEK